MRDKILNKAADLFLSLGFKSVTMDDIAQELGISKKTIYSHFKTKTELVEATTLNIYENITHGIDCICAMHNDPIEELYAIKKFMMVHLNNQKASPQYQLQKYYPEICSTLKSMQFDKMKDCTVKNVTRGIELGLYRPNLDVNFVSRIYYTGISGIKDETLFPSNLFPKAKILEDYLEYHLRGIVTKEGLKTLKKFIKNNPISNE